MLKDYHRNFLDKEYLSVVVPTWIKELPLLNKTDKLVYSRIANIYGINGKFFAAQKTISSDLGISLRTTKRSFKRLENSGLIYGKKRRGLGMTNMIEVELNEEVAKEKITSVEKYLDAQNLSLSTISSMRRIIESEKEREVFEQQKKKDQEMNLKEKSYRCNPQPIKQDEEEGQLENLQPADTLLADKDICFEHPIEYCEGQISLNPLTDYLQYESSLEEEESYVRAFYTNYEETLTAKEIQKKPQEIRPSEDGTSDSIDVQESHSQRCNSGTSHSLYINNNNNNKKEKNIKKRKVGFQFCKEDFDEFWNSYPVKEEKNRALSEFLRVRPDPLDMIESGLSEPAFLQIILQAVTDQKIRNERLEKKNASLPDKKDHAFVKFWKNPAKWLNNGCWRDEIDWAMVEAHERKFAPQSSYGASKGGFNNNSGYYKPTTEVSMNNYDSNTPRYDEKRSSINPTNGQMSVNEMSRRSWEQRMKEYAQAVHDKKQK